MPRTATDRRTGVNRNLRDDFGVKTFDRTVSKIVWRMHIKQRAMRRAMKEVL